MLLTLINRFLKDHRIFLKLPLVIVIAMVTINIVNSAEDGEIHKGCTPRCVAVSVGYLGTIGKVHSLLDRGLFIDIGYTPEIGFKQLNHFLQSSSVAIMKSISVGSSFQFYHFSGPLLERKTDYYAPFLHLKWLKELDNAFLEADFGYGLGVERVSRVGHQKSQLTSAITFNVLYERKFFLGMWGAGIKLGSILDQHYPINHYGPYLNFSKNF